ncbi:hypothetical protein JTB14_020994 [Gonioctena quinquepunctata]|nr:hypothetical protein JTB14_020994 [Gonioctena quinquepunctata]
MSIMWHEARRQERKIRGMLVDYRRRAERRRDFYERIKADPTQFLQVHGRRCKIHLDPNIAAAADSAVMMPWQGQSDILIDRFDVRAHLDYIPPAGKQEEEELTQEDRQINYERYRIIAQNSFLSLSEEKFLKQLHLEEQYGYTEMKSKKEPRTGGAAIGFNYEDGTGIAQPVVPEHEEDSDGNNSDSDLDVDLAINVSKMEPEQAHEMNKHGRNYGMSSNDFYSFLTNDLEEAEAARLAREEEQEKALFSGRKSRRERRYHREKRLANRVISPPSYAAKASPTLPSFRDSKSKSHSRSPSPENSGKITYITSFGDDEDVPSSSKSTYADKVKYGKPKNRRGSSSERIVFLEKGNKSRSRDRSYSTKRRRSSSDSRGKSKSVRSQSRSRRSRSRSRGRRSLSKSRSRRSRSRSRNRRSISVSRSKRSKSWSRGRRSRSRSRNRKSRSRSRNRRNRSRSRSVRSRSNSRTRKSRSRSKDRNKPYFSPRNKGRSIRRRRSTSSSSESSSRSRLRSRSQTSDNVQSPAKKSPEKSPAPVLEPAAKVIPRYYGRKKSDQSSSELSDSDEQDDAEMKPAFNPVSSDSKSGHGNNSGTAIKKSSASMTVIERLKRKRQALLNRQFKADKMAEQIKTEREKLEQQAREDELREMAIKLRRRQREIRHANDSRSSSSSGSDSSSKSKDSEEENTKSRSTSREREEPPKKYDSSRESKDNKEGKNTRDNRDGKEYGNKDYRDGKDSKEQKRITESKSTSKDERVRDRRDSRDSRRDRDRRDRRSPSPRRNHRDSRREDWERDGDKGGRLVDY